MSIYKEPVEWLRQSIDSILGQTYSNFEFLIINDFPNREENDEILEEYSVKDQRIRVIKNDYNRGLIYSLNRGLDIAKGKYIARMDADDIAMPTRFEKQLEYLESHPNCIVCGTKIKYFGERVGYRQTDWLHESDEACKAELLYSSCFAHPSVMYRADVISADICYDPDYLHAEDYKLWSVLQYKGEFHNIQEPLLYYRISPSQITSSVTYNPIVGKIRRENLLLWLKNYGVFPILHDDECICTDLMQILDIVRIKVRRKDACKYSLFVRIAYFSQNRHIEGNFFKSLISGDFFYLSFIDKIRYSQILVGIRQPIKW